MNTKNVVMIVDDEEAIRKLLKARFEREGHTVLTANDASEAGAVLAQNRNISLIVSDVKMPGKDGITFTKEVKEQHTGMKVIVMTGHGEKSTAIQALRIGASDYLEKPFDMEEMVPSKKKTKPMPRMWFNFRPERKTDQASHRQMSSPLFPRPPLTWISGAKRKTPQATRY